MDEASARQVVLAQAIETADTEGRIVSVAERDELDRQARADVIRETRGRAASVQSLLVARSRRLLAKLATHHPRLTALQARSSWGPWLEWGIPILAFVTGVLTDVVGNPHRLDLISLPLLGILAWNVVIYLLLVVGLVMPGRRRPVLARVGRWTEEGGWARRRMGNLNAQVIARFHSLWIAASEPLHVARVKRVLHISAAAWAAGVIVSLLVRGLVVEYRVGWESTFLGPQEVYSILSLLRLPALLVFPFPSFTLQDVARLRFSGSGGVAGGAEWVWMYVALLAVVVILPRLLLAIAAAFGEWRLERFFPLPLQGPYFERVGSLLESTFVQLGVVSHRPEDRQRVLDLLAGSGESLPVAVTTDIGDVLRVIDVPAESVAAAADTTPWWQRMRGWWDAAPADAPMDAPADCDLLLHLGTPFEERRATGVLQSARKPVLFLRPMADSTPTPSLEAATRVIALPSLGGSWLREKGLLEAVAALLPAAKANGFGRLLRAWEARHLELLRASMAVISSHLLFCVRQAEEVPGNALTVRTLLATERQAQADARQAAMEAVALRVRDSATRMSARLRELHGLGEGEAQAIEQDLRERFRVEQSVHAPQAGMAGAATGAAMGASVDLLAGGLTLGAAAALGAIVGGGAAYIAAAWKNRSAPAGASLVQLSDEMMRALANAALLQYVAVSHARRAVHAGVQPAWQQEVGDAVQARSEILAGFWSAARSQPQGERIVQPLAQELEQIVLRALARLYPKAI